MEHALEEERMARIEEAEQKMARIEEAEQGVRDLEEMNQKTMAAGLASGLGVSSLPDIMANAARKLTNDEKAKILPPEGYVFVLGPYVWRVTYRNLGKLRFTATLTGAAGYVEAV